MYQRALFYIFLGICLLPLVHFTKLYYGLEVPRIIWFWVLSTASVLCFGIFRKTTEPIHVSKISLAFLPYLCIVGLSCVFSLNPSLGIYSTFERMDGLFAHIFYGLFLGMFASTKFTSKQWQIVLWLSVSVACITALISINSQHGPRAQGVFGNPVTLAYYMLIHFYCLLAYLIYMLLNKAPYFKLQTALICVLLGLFFYVMVLTQTRALILGLGIGLFVLLIGVFLHKNISKIFKISFLAAIILSISGSFWYLKNSIWLSRITNFNDLSASGRLSIWKACLSHFQENPILGVGKEHFIYFYTKNYSPNMAYIGDWYDKAHNFLLDKLIETGVLGLSSYILFLAYIIIFIILKFKDTWLKISSLGFLAVFVLFHLTHFENFSSLLFFYIGLIFMSQHSSSFFEFPKLKVTYVKICAGLFSGILFFLIVYPSQNTYYTWNKLKHQPFDFQKQNDLFENANVGKLDIGLRYALLRNELFNVPPAIQKEFLNNSNMQLSILEKEYEYYPITLNQKAYNYLSLGDLANAKKSFQDLQRLAPNRQANLLDLGMVYAQTGESIAAENTFKIIKKLDRDYLLADIYLALTYAYQKKSEASNALLLNLNRKDVIAEMPRILEVAKMNNGQKELLKKVGSPTFEDLKYYGSKGFQYWVDLAVLCENNGQIDYAIQSYVIMSNYHGNLQNVKKLILDIQTKKRPSSAFYDVFRDHWFIDFIPQK